MSRLYNFNVTWTYAHEEDPGHRLTEYGIKAYCVQRACSKVTRTLVENGYLKDGIRIIDCQNMDIC